MRFSVKLELKSSKPHLIPVTYRRNITAMLKEALLTNQKTVKTFEGLYRSKIANTQKPFTFSVYIPQTTNVRRGDANFISTEADCVNLIFSSSDEAIFCDIYNALCTLDHSYPVFAGIKTRLKTFRLLSSVKIQHAEQKFKTLAPFVLSRVDKGRSNGWVRSCDPVFSQMLKTSICSQAAVFLKPMQVSPDQIVIKNFNLKEATVTNYKVAPAMRGTIEISAPTEVLQLLYDSGLGSKRSQGFGMLEVV